MFDLENMGQIEVFKFSRVFKSVKGVSQTAVLSGNHKTKYAVLFRLLTQTKEAPKKEKDCQE